MTGGFFRLLRAILHLLRGYWIIRSRFPRITQSEREATVKMWSAQLLTILGIELRVSGTPLSQGMLVANHISWLDILAIHAAHFCRFVAKSDIRQWPVIGYLTAGSGTLFIERTSRKDAHRTVKAIADHLQAGQCVAVFPEGTTSDGHSLLPFHANLIESAVQSDVQVQPLALRFIDKTTGAQSFAPCYIGDESLLTSVWRTLQANTIAVEVQFGAAQQARGRDRRTWATDLRSDIKLMLA